jgi:hypothetical protein
MTQVRKFFGKQIKETIKNIYNEQFDTRFVVYTPFSNG